MAASPASSKVHDSSSTAIPATHLSASAAVWACAAMAFFYVAILYSPTLILRLPPPTSLRSFMLRRFACAAVSSAASVLACIILLGPDNFDDCSSLLRIFGIRGDHLWQAVFFPLFLTSSLYAGSFTKKLWQLSCTWEDRGTANFSGASAGDRHRGYNCINRIAASVRNVLVWRNYVVAPITEELVFRACMIPLLLCGGFKISSIIFFTPIFFSLAHLNHLMELYYQQNCNLLKAFLIVGLQLCYTVIFGWYASFLFIRTGNLISPIVAHIFCNVMGLPVYASSQTKGAATIALSVGVVSFFYFLFLATNPDLYNERSDNCSCWHGYCSWKPTTYS